MVPPKLADMTTCPYCSQPATMNIIATPSRVCIDHAAEFWTGALAYSHARTGVCTKSDQLCACPRCQEMAEEFAKAETLKRVRAAADDVDAGIRLAS
ncbi:MAG: hypothetical protein JWL71_279 [Acidobacteria bacterium]|nr:hypothetical protein [Acidobacteriota bacterium]